MWEINEAALMASGHLWATATDLRCGRGDSCVEWTKFGSRDTHYIQ